MSLILASSSPRRLALLKQMGFTPDQVIPADINEDPHISEKPRPYVTRMAREKALALPATDAFILAADTIVCGAHRILPKAEDAATARDCLRWMSGRRHQAITAVAIAHDGRILRQRLVATRIRFRQLSAQDIEAYIASGEWEGKAGGYGIQGCAEAFITEMQGSYSAVVGLPLYETQQMLRSVGLTV
ncbi:MAG: septum formation inhibitor Maf [Rickettsiales bacterium]|nr:septum formation inhibitor Maf [Rickettsiales bacterium]|tara:strand:- start:2242 stop:2805 length:564 start_codon:yes stop_codon:yes gene_type:complete